MNTAKYLLLHTDTQNHYLYTDSQGDTVIRPGKYDVCFTDTFRDYAIVALQGKFIAINRDEKKLYEVFAYDNGPDYVAEGLFRIKDTFGKIGYADAATGKIIIPPQFEAAFPFENSKSLTGCGCITQYDGEHSTWICSKWYHIDKHSRRTDSMRSPVYFVWLTDLEQKIKIRNPYLSGENIDADSVIKGLNQIYRNIPLKKIKISGDTLYTNIPQSYYLTERMGSTGASEYIAQAAINLLSVKDINFVNVDFEEGEHATPGTWSRKDFDDIKEVQVHP